MEIASSLVRAAEDAVAERKMKTAFMLLNNAAVTLLQAMQDYEFQGERYLAVHSFANVAKLIPHLASVVSTMATITERLQPRSSSLRDQPKRPSSPTSSINENIPSIPTPLILQSYLSACNELVATNSKLKSLTPNVSLQSHRRLIELRALYQLQIDQIEGKMKSGSELSIARIRSPGDIAKVIVSISARLQSDDSKSKKGWLEYLENLTAHLIVKSANESTEAGAEALQKLISTAELLLTKYKDYEAGDSVLRGIEHSSVTRLVSMWGSASPSILKTRTTLRSIVPPKKPKKLAEVQADEQIECWLLNQAYVQNKHLLRQSYLAEAKRPEEVDPQDRANRAQALVASLTMEANIPSPPRTPLPPGGLQSLINALLTKQPMRSSSTVVASHSSDVWSPSSGPLASHSKPTLSTSLTSVSRDQSPFSHPSQNGTHLQREIDADLMSLTDSVEHTPPSSHDSFEWASDGEGDELRELTRQTVQKVMDEMKRTKEDVSRRTSTALQEAQRALNETKDAVEPLERGQVEDPCGTSIPSEAPDEDATEMAKMSEMKKTVLSLADAATNLNSDSIEVVEQIGGIEVPSDFPHAKAEEQHPGSFETMNQCSSQSQPCLQGTASHKRPDSRGSVVSQAPSNESHRATLGSLNFLDQRQLLNRSSRSLARDDTLHTRRSSLSTENHDLLLSQEFQSRKEFPLNKSQRQQARRVKNGGAHWRGGKTGGGI
ncbi:hypothetical protein NEOLI_000309 [Neolecta irregularis DAH-3]|uniref:Uncharacterized protein n=1 Tax=Neolecta irregularis (strain DAH-3) TaxID=1198029 RepID=A0A1U7LUB0_NEOID|nr:hypothetical protein NEOLI_000309 [Neolecta irregularis DAH-3]|eukprot:OLL26260.1 hypothetical protein NEOLI_000309 [Neolecta irregularis DAH-3]